MFQRCTLFNDNMSLLDEVRAILLDIEGTTTPIAFVHDVLFTYAREHVRAFLSMNPATDDVALLREEHAVDVKEGRNPPPLTAEYIEWLIALDRKSTGLKSLQGKIWRQGYEDGSLRAQVFAEVAPAFERWRERGIGISIFSSGSVLAQQLLFAHTEVGDLTPFIDGYFDTRIGKKGEAESYRKIAEAMDLETRQILFISDVVTELHAANQSGMKTIMSIRPGNELQPQYPSIRSFDEIR
jgi:enolase-phosphatase E1